MSAGLTWLIRSLALMTLIKNLGHHSGNTRQRIHGGVPRIVVLCLKVARHSMCPKGEPFPRQLERAIATSFPHLHR
jgi:hypothetical protein